jgi:hypothetical protein
MNQQGSGFLHKMTFSMKWLRGGRARTSRGTGTNQFGILYKFALKRQRSRSTGVELSGMWSIKPMTPCAFVNDSLWMFPSCSVNLLALGGEALVF